MTKEEILNGMSEEEFYSLYPTREAWEQAQQQMAYGGIPDIMGVPFGAGIMLANGGTPYYGGPIYPAQYGTSVFTEKKMTPQQWEKYNIERGYQKVPAGKAQSNKPGAYSEFYNPKEYTMGEEAWGHGPAQSFKKVGAPADYDYNKDPNYKPIVQYGYKDPIVSKPVMPWSPAGTVAGSKEGLFYKNQNPALGKFVFREGKYTQYMDDQVAAATPVTPSPAAPVINKYGGAPCYECGGLHMEEGGGLSRGEDYGSKKKPYPSVKASDFAGGGRSYPIPTRADAVDALRLAGLHGRSDVKAKVYAKYPDLKKQVGGSMTPDLEGQYPIFGYGGYDSPFNYGQFPAMRSGGDLTSQGGNQDFLNNRTSTYMNYIKNNVLNNMHEEESQNVQDAFMQIESQYMQGGGSSYDMINPQNAALQNMYSQQLQGYKNQWAQDAAEFRNVLLPQGKDGIEQPTHSNILHQLAAEFGPSSRRTGLPLFPGNMSPYYGISKKDAKKLVGIPEGFRMEGLEVTPEWGLGARTAMNVGNWFRGKDSKKTIPGWAPKKIHYKFTGKRGYLPGEPRPDTHETLTPPAIGPKTAYDQANPYGPIPAGTTQAPVPFLPSSIKPGYDASGNRVMPNGMKEKDFFKQPYIPGEYNWNFQLPTGPMGQPAFPMNKPGLPASEQFNQVYKKDPFEGVPQGFIPKQIFMQSQLAYGGNYFNNGGYPTLLTGYGNPIKITNASDQYTFVGQQPTPNYASQAFGKTNQIKVADESKNTPYVQSPRVQYDATKDRSQENVSIEGDFRKKWKGVGETIGQYAVPAMNMLASMFEKKDAQAAKKKMEESMMADNTFLTTPMNAMNRGDYDINSGMFRPDDMVPVQFPGYAQWGGFNTMQKGGTSKKDSRQVMPQDSWDQFKYGIKSGINMWKDVLPNQHSWDQFKQGFMSAFPNDGLDQLKQGFKQGIQSWIPDQNTIDKFNQAFPSNNPRSFIYKEEGGDISEGEELDLSPEEIEELRQQGYEIEYLD